MKLWIDDIRPAPEGYVWIKSVCDFRITFWQAIAFGHTIEEISLDHDAGVQGYWGGDYIKVLDYLEEISHNKDQSALAKIENINFHIHSQNPVGVENMRRIIKRNGWREA